MLACPDALTGFQPDPHLRCGQVSNLLLSLKHEELAWVTLVTCHGYDQASNSYLYRLLVQVVLVEVK
jgi:hypothetical protein